MRTKMVTPVLQSRGIEAIREGLRFIVATPVIWGIMLLDFLATLVGSTVGLAPVFAKDVLNAGPQGLGLLLSAPAAGAVIGAVIVSLLPQFQRPGRMVVISVIVYGICLALFGMSGTLIAAMLALVGAGAADSVSVAMRHTVRTIATPDELRGRVAAAHSALAMGGPRLGEFQSGMTAAIVGPRAAMMVGGAGCIVVALLIGWFVPPMMQYRFDRDGNEQADTPDAIPTGVSGLPADGNQAGFSDIPACAEPKRVDCEVLLALSVVFGLQQCFQLVDLTDESRFGGLLLLVFVPGVV